MDRDSMKSAFDAVYDNCGYFTRRMAIVIARQFGLEPMAMSQRLEDEEIIPRGSTVWFKRNGGITANHIEQEKQGKLI